VASAPPDWERFTRPGWEVEFSYPTVTPEGHDVERAEEQANDHRGAIERVHLTSAGSGELYFEAARFRGETPEGEYLNHTAYLRRRFGDEAVTELSETTVAGRAGWAYGLRTDEGEHERSLLLLPIGSDTYRFIYDPRSELNAKVLASLTVTE
jgi:hypothetical protein